MNQAAVLKSNPAHQAFQILHFGYTLLPVLAGADKFFHFLVDWNQYLSPLAVRLLPVSVTTFMLAVGVIEIIAGLIVAFRPQIGGYIVAAWLLLIILNLLSIPGYFDIACRDFGLLLGAIALARLAAGVPVPDKEPVTVRPAQPQLNVSKA